MDKAWLKNHPDILSWDIEEQYRRIHADGGFIVHAHPFRVRPYILKIRLFPTCVDAVEGINVRNRNDGFDRRALTYAKDNNLPVTAGTDAHGHDTLRSGVAFQHKIENISGFIEDIKAGNYELIKPR